MTKKQIAILAGLGLAVVCVLCFGAYIVIPKERAYREAIAPPTAMPQPTATKPPTRTPIPRPTAPPFEEIRSKRGNVTDAQWDNYRHSLEGAIVQWVGWVGEVHEPENGSCKVAVDMDSPDANFSAWDVHFELPANVALQLQKDQLIAFSGQIESVDVFLGALDVDLVKDTAKLLPTPTPGPTDTPTRVFPEIEPTETLPTPTRIPTQKPAPLAPVYELEWVSVRSYTEPEWGLAYSEGEVKNISDHSLHSVIVVVTWYDSADNFITSDWDFIQYDPLLPGQTSPYKVISTYNPAMAKVKTGFQKFGGAAIPTK